MSQLPPNLPPNMPPPPPSVPPQGYAPQYGPPQGYYPPPLKKSNAGLIVGIIIGCVVLFGGCGISILLPALSRAREVANQMKCMMNLRQIGNGINMYVSSNAGRLPDKLSDILPYSPNGTAAFVCPTSSDTPAKGASDLHAGGHLSYNYLGKGLKISQLSNANKYVLVFENPSDHNGHGVSVLYADGHVEFKKGAVATQVLGELTRGLNPPPSDQTTP